jgi:hypothetical protein
MPPCLANHPNTSRREILAGKREQLLQVSVEERGNTSERVPSREQEKYKCSIFLKE